jgi:membrane protein
LAGLHHGRRARHRDAAHSSRSWIASRVRVEADSQQTHAARAGVRDAAMDSMEEGVDAGQTAARQSLAGAQAKMLSYFQPPIPWREVVRRTIAEVGDDNCIGLAAQLSFYFLLALFPALLFLVALVGYIRVDNAFDELLAALSTVAPRELIELLRAQVAELAEGRHASLLTLGIAGALWSSSAAMVAIIDALNRAYDVTEWRSWWKRRLVALLLTVALAAFVLVSLVLVLVGPGVLQAAAAWVQLAPSIAGMWAVLRWPVMILCVVVGVDLVFHFAPNRKSRWVLLTPGSLIATALWIASSFAFKYYVSNFGDYTATYGAIGGAIITMLWFYVSSLAILVGAELNAEIEHAWREVPRRAGAAPAAAVNAAAPERARPSP